MKLYNYFRSATSYRLRMALEHMGLDYEHLLMAAFDACMELLGVQRAHHAQCFDATP